MAVDDYRAGPMFFRSSFFFFPISAGLLPISNDQRRQEQEKDQQIRPVMSDQEEENAVLAFDESLVPVRERKLPGITSLTFDKLLNEPLLLKEDLKSGCGGQLWPAGMLLAEYLLREQRESLRGKTMFVVCTGPQHIL